MTELADLTARAEPLLDRIANAIEWGAINSPLLRDLAALIRDLLTYATTVSQERDDAKLYAKIYGDAVADWRPIIERVEGLEATLVTALARAERAEQERDVAIAQAEPAAPLEGEDIYKIRVFREDDGRYAAEYMTGDDREGGMGEYSVTPVGALAELTMALIKIEEDKRLHPDSPAAPSVGEIKAAAFDEAAALADSWQMPGPLSFHLRQVAKNLRETGSEDAPAALPASSPAAPPTKP